MRRIAAAILGSCVLGAVAAQVQAVQAEDPEDAVAPADDAARAVSESAEFRAAAPPRLEPGSVAVGEGDGECRPGAVYEWTSEQGLRYTWSLPPTYEQGKGHDMVVLCHGTGLDYRWGHANHDPHAFRPNDIIISPDGTSEGEAGSRLFLGEAEDAIIFRDFLLEMARTFPARGIFLYGHSQGGFFVAYFAGEWPAATEGVVAHASGAWNWTNREGGIQGVPLVFMHGTADEVVPYRQSPASRDAFAEVGHEMVVLRRLPEYGHWPNPVRASEGIDYCLGMMTNEADEALTLADALLEPKEKDRFGYSAAPPFACAVKICRRVLASEKREGMPYGVPDFDEPATVEEAARARALLEEMDAHAAKHVAALEAHTSSRAGIVLDGSSWLGHMISVREDMRGLDAVEDYVERIGFDREREDHIEASRELYEAWYGQDVSESEKFEAVAETLPTCFLAEGLPRDLLEQMMSLHAAADELELSDSSLEKFEFVELHQHGWDEGLAAYEALWATWRQPEPPPPPEPEPAVAQQEEPAPTVEAVSEETVRSGALSGAVIGAIIGGAIGVLVGSVIAVARHRRRVRAAATKT